MLRTSDARRGIHRPVGACRWLTILVVIAAVGVMIGSLGLPSAARAATLDSTSPLLSDNFGQDTSLNPSIWQVSGPVGLAFGTASCPACTNITLAPSFSSAGMEIAQADGNSEVGTIQSIASFAPPLTATALVEGIISNGHPIVFGISNGNASAGVQMTGNLNPDDCSQEANCGNPSTCGTPANSSIAPDQCFYGIYARSGGTGTHWKKSPDLNQTPSVGLVYTLQISVDSSGNAQFNVSAGGQVLGQSTDQVGTGPFYIIIAQSEGVPVPGPGPNEAVWLSVAVTPTAPTVGSTSSPSSSSGLSSAEWIIIVVVIAAILVLVAVLRTRQRRLMTVTVLDGESLSPVPGAGVSMDGPKSFTGSTEANGRVAFGHVQSGDYSVTAIATGFAPALPVKVVVPRTMAQTIRLQRLSAPAGRTPVAPPPAAPSPPGPVSPVAAPAAVPPVPTAAPAPPAPPPAAGMETEESEGWAGERLRRIIQTFEEKGALSPATALTAEELGLSRMFVRIMKRRRGRTKVFVEVDGKYYLDQSALRGAK